MVIKKGLNLIIFISLLMLGGCCSLMGDDVCNRPGPPRNCMAELKKQDVQFIRVGETVIIVIPSDELFNRDSANFSEDGNKILETLTCVLQPYETTTMKIAGYTDNCGSAIRNKALSARQAQNVANYLAAQRRDGCCVVKIGDLTTQKIDARIIYAVGYGQNYPVATNDTEEGRAKNRHVEIRFRHLLPPLY